MGKKIEKQFLVLGLGRFGTSVAKTLSLNGCDVLAVDKSHKKIDEIKDCVTHSVIGSMTDIEFLKQIGAGNFDVAIVAAGSNLEASILATLNLKDLGVEEVIVKAQNSTQKKVLEKIGADRVVFPEREMGAKVANSLMSKNILDFIELSDEYSIAEIDLYEEWEGKSLKEISLRGNYGINVIALRGENGKLSIAPKADAPLKKGQVLVAIGRNTVLKEVDFIKK
ncbi:MAG: TrkA family potassium uptake protein [Clostridia bacterium]|jgi:trk system potassium uptake protein TrkA|nr:TrkA family potassium uptake protein [Clostridia bacterium]